MIMIQRRIHNNNNYNNIDDNNHCYSDKSYLWNNGFEMNPSYLQETRVKPDVRWALPGRVARPPLHRSDATHACSIYGISCVPCPETLHP